MASFMEKLDRLLFPFLGFRCIWIAILTFCIPSLLIHIFLWPSSNILLSLSANNPLRIFTAPFVHDNLTHFFTNLTLFLSFTFFFVAVNLSKGLEKRKYISRVFFGIIFLVGTFISGPAELIYRSFVGEAVRVMGSSGIVYAALGVLLTSCLINLFFRHGQRVKELFSDELTPVRPGERFLFYVDFAFNLAIVCVVILWVFSPDFLGVGPNIGKVAHASGFLAGFAASFFFFLDFSKLKELAEEWSGS